MSADSTEEGQRDQEFVSLITQHQPALSALCHSLVADRVGADEVLQEANLVIWRKREEFAVGTNFRAWAFKIVRFQVLAWRQREARRSARWTFDDEVLDQLADSAEEVFAKQGERVEALRHCLQKLSAEDRKLLDGHYDEELPMEEQAVRAGRSIGALRQVLYRIRNSLRGCIEKTMASSDWSMNGEGGAA